MFSRTVKSVWPIISHSTVLTTLRDETEQTYPQTTLPRLSQPILYSIMAALNSLNYCWPSAGNSSPAIFSYSIFGQWSDKVFTNTGCMVCVSLHSHICWPHWIRPEQVLSIRMSNYGRLAFSDEPDFEVYENKQWVVLHIKWDHLMKTPVLITIYLNSY